jgi:polar amino acid transport system substrate-binding protein
MAAFMSSARGNCEGRRARGLSGVRRTVAWAAALLALWCPIATAETPFVPDEWRYGRRQESSVLNYCLDARDPDLPVARRIAQAIAAALLLEPREHVIGENVAGESLDSLYRLLLETCEVHLGFKLIPDAYPEWLKVTRPYYRASYVVVATDPRWRALSDMPTSQAIGATIGTSADLRLIQHLLALAPAQRWSRFPMSSDAAALQALVNGTIGSALIWGPALWALQRRDPAFSQVRVISSSPLAASTMDVGAALLANEAFLRTSIDQAIASLTTDGTIQALLGAQGFPAAPVR